MKLPIRFRYDHARISALKNCQYYSEFLLACQKNDNKNIETKSKVCSSFLFIRHLAFLRPTLGYWQWRSLTQLMLITTPFQVQPESHREPRNEVGSQNLTERISGIRSGKLFLPLLSVTCFPIVPLSSKVYYKQLTVVLLVSFQRIVGFFH